MSARVHVPYPADRLRDRVSRGDQCHSRRCLPSQASYNLRGLLMPRRTTAAALAHSGSSLAGLPLASPVVGGAHVDNMAPLNPKTLTAPQSSAVTVLQRGLDKVWLNVYGTLREDVALCLEMSLEDARESPADVALAPLPPFEGVTPLMQAKGAPYYTYRMVSHDLTVLIRKPSKSPRPPAQIQVSAECLWRLGGGGLVAARLAEHYLRPLFEAEGYRVQVSRIDLATDYQGHVLTHDDMLGVVKRPRVVKEHPEHDGVLQWHSVRGGYKSIAAGQSKALRINLYDKTLEIEKSGKDWFADLWERHQGYVAGVPVWRNEFEYGREFLRDFERPGGERGLDTLDQCLEHLPALWAYGMRWFSFRTPNAGDKQPYRWPVADWWAALSTWSTTDTAPLAKVKQVRPHYRRLQHGLFGYLTSYMAVTDEYSVRGALAGLLRDMRRDRGSGAMDAALLAKQRRYAGFTMAD